jgi:chitinase
VPSCSVDGTIRQRSIGYYEGWSPSRPCDARNPEDLDVTALTHVYFSFAYLDPSTFRITPMSPDDVPLYTRFTDLKKRKPSLQTWIAVGGWALNDPGNTPDTRTAFSDMARTASGRRAFIDSLLQSMETYNFDGVDLDWEYPTAEDRGGSPGDTENLVSLLRDMRNRFGTSYGISIAIPASYWYLRNFDVQGMTRYVDWLNLMTYVGRIGCHS